ncbi:MAG TPA: hypothetical protein GX525_10685 [Bacilli bacterium]|nr:hypothetical protein [Bacilli bacterium]
MHEYMLTVFEKTGELLLEEKIEATSDEAAKEAATKKLEENQYIEHTHRLVRSGKLIMFHS